MNPIEKFFIKIFGKFSSIKGMGNTARKDANIGELLSGTGETARVGTAGAKLEEVIAHNPKNADSIKTALSSNYFQKLQNRSIKDIEREWSEYARANGLTCKASEGSIELRDSSGKVVRECHRGFFDEQWYDHHFTYNAMEKPTGTFIVQYDGELSSALEYAYKEDGSLLCSYGVGRKNGKFITASPTGKLCDAKRMTLKEFTETYGFTPEYYGYFN